jgi:uncharacterized membrane protein
VECWRECCTFLFSPHQRAFPLAHSMSAASLLPDEVPQWVLACGLSLVGTTCSTLGLNVQKLGHVHHAAAERRAARALERRRRQADVQWERARLHAGASVGGGAYGVDKTVIGGAGDDDYDDGGDVERGVASPLLAPGGSGPSSGASSGAATTVGTSAGIGPDAGFGAGADGDTGSDVNPFAVAGFGAGSNSSSLSGGGLSAPSGARTPARKHAHAHADVNSCAGAGASTGKAVSSAFASVLAPVPPVYRHPVWLFGLGIFLLGEVLTGVAMGFGSQSLVAVLSSCALLSNALFAALIHGERASRGYAVAAAAIIAGAICVVLAAPHGNQDYDLAKLSRLFRSALFHTFAAAVLVLLALALCARALLPRSALLAALVAALVASFSVLFAKCSMQLVKASVEQLTRATVSATQSAGQTVSAVIAGAAAAVTGTAATNSAANGTAVAPASVPVAVPVPVPGEQSVDIFQPLSWLIFLLFIFCASVTYVPPGYTHTNTHALCTLLHTILLLYDALTQPCCAPSPHHPHPLECTF